MDRRGDQRRLDQERLAQMRQAQQQAGAETSEDRGFVSEQPVQPVLKMTKERVQEAYHRLMRYKSGKAHLDARLVEVEQWWKIRHWEWMQERGARDDMKTQSAWLFNVIISKHADGIQSIPEANILPREENDKETAKLLSSIIPCVLEENGFEETDSSILWQKLKGGTGVYGCFWDPGKLNGLGDISIQRINLLNLFWEPGVSDIQRSRDVFLVEPVDKELLVQQYPQLSDDTAISSPVSVRKFMTEDSDAQDDKAYVVDWYYHGYSNGKKVLHYAKFVGDTVLYATEDVPELAERGLYDHGEYPFVMDALFPVEGSPCGFGYIDVCKNAQEQIDIINQALIKNTLVNAIPRYFCRSDGSVNEEEFLDFTRSLVHVTGNVGNDSLVPIETPALQAMVLNVLENKIGELKETSGNTDSSNGITQNSSQAASAIAALQEASGKVSRASSMSAYRAFSRLIKQVIELIRQFYDLPRQFRITGDMGEERFVSFTNAGMLPQQQGVDFGIDMGYRLPVFDIKIEPQTKNRYTKNSQNELALSLYQLGVFNPQMADQSMMLLDMMDFDGKDELQQKVAQNQMLLQQLAMYQQMALQLAQQVDPAMAEQMAANITGEQPQSGHQSGGSGHKANLNRGNEGGSGGADTKMSNARETSKARAVVQ